MLSLIICSRNSEITQLLKDNIAGTIGLEYELVIIDNSGNQYSIFQAYNEGVRRAMYPYLCFMHEDILFHTQDWGQKVLNHFQNKKIGLIGTFGSHFMPKTPIGWYQPKVISGGGLQGLFENGTYRTERQIYSTYIKDDLSIEAVVVDGLWFCIPKSLFSLLSFDEDTFSGYHCYDLDICLQIRRSDFQVRIISDILLEHFSSGAFDQDWVNNTLLFFNKWKEQLPQVAGVNLSLPEMKLREELVAETFLWISGYAQLSEELKNLRHSKAYKLGKLITKHFSKLRKLV